MNSENDIDQQSTFSFGKRLSTARCALNLSREDVAKELRLGLDIVIALETEDYEQLAVPIFVTGYIRNYARLLKIPVEPLLAAYSQVQVVKPTIVSDAISKPGPAYSALMIKSASVVIVLVLITGVVSWVQSQDYEFSTWFTSQASSESNQPLVELPPLPVLAEPDEVAVVNDVVEVTKESAPEIATIAVVEPVKTAPLVVKNDIVLSFTEDSWVDFKDSSGKRLIYDLLRAGRERRVTGTPPFKVFLGNAKGVKIEYNGELINVAQYIRGKLARFQFGTAEE